MSENNNIVDPKNDGPLTVARVSWLAEALHAIKQTAQDLLDWCTGGHHQGRHWSPREQADWLVREARATWDEWEGPKALRGLFLSRFGSGRQQRPELPPFQSYGKPNILCRSCEDQGTQWNGERYIRCNCELGRAMPPNLLEIMNSVKSIDARSQAPNELPNQSTQYCDCPVEGGRAPAKELAEGAGSPS